MYRSNDGWLVGWTVAVFNFTTGIHNVMPVGKAGYDGCSTQGTVGPTLTTGPATVTLKAPGAHYYICGVPTHCSFGQKLAVNVSAAAGPAPSPSPSPSGPSAPPPGGPAPEAPTTPTPPSAPAPASPGAAPPPGSSSAAAPPSGSAVWLLALLSAAAAAAAAGGFAQH
ncbi:umecyanin-like [Ananas comosus]|uniref:Umecyanin-like n=1 Tax=Ananas comosus TaxID=4615 RepID=A0A6P5ECP2_ANACO|nr:umecyanin-like [Ananas comosus]